LKAQKAKILERKILDKFTRNLGLSNRGAEIEKNKRQKP
jgi:hypothetical protein